MKRIGCIAALLLLAACTVSEGERCNPLLFQSSGCTPGQSCQDDCQAGYLCLYPANCGVAYCCPATGKSSDPNCAACPGSDGGTDAGTDGGARD